MSAPILVPAFAAVMSGDPRWRQMENARLDLRRPDVRDAIVRGMWRTLRPNEPEPLTAPVFARSGSRVWYLDDEPGDGVDCVCVFSDEHASNIVPALAAIPLDSPDRDLLALGVASGIRTDCNPQERVTWATRPVLAGQTRRARSGPRRRGKACRWGRSPCRRRAARRGEAAWRGGRSPWVGHLLSALNEKRAPVGTVPLKLPGKADEPEHWPEALRVREFPVARV